ncbi:MAG: ABC transporter ATP-binding protein/permease [Chitinivibrionia bacterium]|nr:ABC transporter ATP-binding protein/permease [Chitinivibrionia bacterium]
MSEELDKVEKYDSDPLAGMTGQQALAGKAKDPKATIKKIMAYLLPHKIAFAACLILAVLSTAFAVAGPRLLGRITTALVDGIVAHWMGTGLLTNFPYMATIMWWLAAIFILSAACRTVQGIIMARISAKITYKLRSQISEKMHKLPINYYDSRERSQGDILSRITNDVDRMSQTLNESLMQLVSSATTIIGVLIMMISISLLMTAASLITIPTSMLILGVILKKSYIYFGNQQKAIGEMSGIVEETYSGRDIVRAFNSETDAEEKFDKTNEKIRSSAWKAEYMTNIIEPVFGFVFNLGYVLICVLGGWLTVQRVITIGDVQAFLQYIGDFTQPLGELGASANTMQATIVSAERVFEFLEENEEVADIENHSPKNNADGAIRANDDLPLQQENIEYQGNITFKNVHFGYTPDKITINDFSAEVNAGQKVAIVGPSGCGKTTLVKLLMRFYELNSGQILIDGVNSTEFSRNDWRNMFGMVLQDTWIYNASIMENIRYGSPAATDEEVIAAAKTAHCDHFIHTLPQGYHSTLNEDATNISAGQKQLLTIARVILKDPHILILDEATSSIDTRTEVLIQQAMKTVMKDRTSFVIAHRLSTIRDADVIFVMRDGDIIEHGNHDHLLAMNGFYADLYNSQFSEGVVSEEE